MPGNLTQIVGATWADPFSPRASGLGLYKRTVAYTELFGGTQKTQVDLLAPSGVLVRVIDAWLLVGTGFTSGVGTSPKLAIGDDSAEESFTLYQIVTGTGWFGTSNGQKGSYLASPRTALVGALGMVPKLTLRCDADTGYIGNDLKAGTVTAFVSYQVINP